MKFRNWTNPASQIRNPKFEIGLEWYVQRLKENGITIRMTRTVDRYNRQRAAEFEMEIGRLQRPFSR
jgi:hypothetical protein